MKRAVFILIAISIFSASGAAAGTAADLKSLVEAERAFARLSAEKGIRTAFLANLAPDAVVFRPTPIPGRKAYEERSEIPGRLSWQPSFADISRAGDLGYTTGPYEFLPEGAGKGDPSYGHYVSVWRVQADGSWKVVIDVGITHPRPQTQASDIKLDKVWMPVPSAPTADPGRVRSTLIAADKSLADAAEKTGRPNALFAAFAEDARIYRPGLVPFIGRAAAVKASAGLPDKWIWAPTGGGAAASGDLGYTYGTLKIGQDEFSYFRIWNKLGDGWTIVLDLWSPVSGKTGP
jgi:ketosteroid isomerase-like protein